MAKILDLDNLTEGTEVVFDTTTTPRTIRLVKTGNLSDDGVTMQCLYSFCKRRWKLNSSLVKHPFPIVSITDEMFELTPDWDFYDDTSRLVIRDGGWARKDSSGTSIEEYMCVASLGTMNNAAADTAYYQQATGATPTDINLTGPVNQAIKIYGDSTHGDFDYRDYFKMFLREQGKVYASYDLLSEQVLSTLTYKKYQLPLTNSIDQKVTASDNTISTTTPYTGMSITWYGTPQSKSIGGSNYNFSIIIDGNNGTLQEIYEYVQYELRQSTDIDAGAGTVRGDTADALLKFVGDRLDTIADTNGNGVFVENILDTDKNSIRFQDDTGTYRTYPYVAAGRMEFNSNLQNDSDAYYRVFFTNDDAGDNLGYDYGTDNAITIKDADGNDIAGDIGGVSFKTFTFDYDGNVQRGTGSAGEDAPYTAIASGYATAKFAVAVGTITQSTSNVITFVSELERTFSNPA